MSFSRLAYKDQGGIYVVCMDISVVEEFSVRCDEAHSFVLTTLYLSLFCDRFH